MEEKIPTARLVLLLIVLIFLLYNLLASMLDKVEENLYLLIFQLGFVLLPSLLITVIGNYDTAKTLRLQLVSGSKITLGIILGFSGWVLIVNLLIWIFKLFPPPPAKEILDKIYPLLLPSPTLEETITKFILVSLLPAMSEEIFFRGLVQKSFEKNWGKFKGIFGAALLFSIYHFHPSRFIPTFLMGAYLGVVASTTDSICVTFIAHFTHNTLIFLWSNFPGITNSLGHWITLPQFIILQLLVFIGCLGLFLTRRRIPNF